MGSDVEILIGGFADDTLWSDVPNAAVIGNFGNDTVTLAAPGAAIGDYGNDSLHGSAGNDYLEGGNGDDTVEGGAGRDQLFGAIGNDLLLARDGEADDVNCGGDLPNSNDSAQIDAGLESSVSNCETLLP